MDLIHIGSRSPCTPFSSSLHDTTFSRQSTPHFLALFQPPVETLRKPLETQGNPHSCSGNPEVTPLNAFTHLCALTRLSPCIAHFVFGRRRLDVCTVLDGGNTQPLSTLSGQGSLTRALKTSCHLELKIRWLPSPLLTSRHLWDSNPRGETPSA